jgi:hypothetical protein
MTVGAKCLKIGGFIIEMIAINVVHIELTSIFGTFVRALGGFEA